MGWSHGGFIISYYVRAHGEDYIAGALMLNENLDNIGPGFTDKAEGATARHLPTIISAMRSFIRACTDEPIAGAFCYECKYILPYWGARDLKLRLHRASPPFEPTRLPAQKLVYPRGTKTKPMNDGKIHNSKVLSQGSDAHGDLPLR